MRAITGVVLLATVLLVTAALAGEISTAPGQTERSRTQAQSSASRTASSDQSANALVPGTPSRGTKAETPGLMNYQGTLTDAGGLALDTTVAMTFSIYSDSVGGAQVWTETQPSVAVTGGIFSVLLGRVSGIADTVFNDPQRWLGVQVGGDLELAPRQRIAAVGYAFRAAEADTAEYARSGAGGGADNDWVRGTPDSVLFTAAYLGIARGGASNVLYGDSVYTHINLGVACTTGAPFYNYHFCTVGGGWNNTAGGPRATVGGGAYNSAAWVDATVSGGNHNTASGHRATVGGGYDNTASDGWAIVGGGANNTASGLGTTISGGTHNTASGYAATVGGGYLNFVAGDYSAILGGWCDTITVDAYHSYLFGIDSKLTEDSTFMVDMPHIRFGDETDGYEFPPTDGSSGQVLVTDGGGALSWQSGTDNNWVRGTPDSVLFTAGYLGIARGGAGNALYGDSVHTHINLGVACTTGVSGGSITYSTVGGGYGNTASDYSATVSGGYDNTASRDGATVSGGGYNTASDYSATVSGGSVNTASGTYATVGGGHANTASESRATVGGGYENTASGWYATVGGGTFNTANGSRATVGGGDQNTASGFTATVSGGYLNFVGGENSAILGGYRDTIATGADYSYLFGIESMLTEDSTFMVDMPHICFGDETDGYEFPPTDGSSGQVLVTDGGGALSWQQSADNDWVRGTPDSVLFTAGYLGIARGGAGNVLYGDSVHTHINLGVACTTGVSSGSVKYSTVGGGLGNTASEWSSIVSGGYDNTASGNQATVGGGGRNTASAYFATVGGGSENRASEDGTTVGGGWINKASEPGAAVGGGYGNTASAYYANIGGGYRNYVAGSYSAILGGIRDTIATGANYSYLFGINSKLTEDSTFMVDMPHTILTGGNVGIGTASPDEELHVAGQLKVSTTGSGHIIIDDTNGGGSKPGIQFINNSTLYLGGDDGSNEAFGFYSIFSNIRNYDAQLRAYGKAADSWGTYVELTHDGTDGFINTDIGDLALNPSGNVGVGTSSPTRKLWVNGDAGGTSAWYNDSDERLKKNISHIEGALDKVDRLEGVYFEWRDTEHHPEGKQVGLIAQEVAEVVPEVVEQKGDYYSLATANLVPVLIEAVKEQQEIISSQQDRIEELAQRLEVLEK